MPCVSPDGKPTGTGVETLRAVKNGASTPADLAAATGQPLFKIRSGLRELVGAGFLEISDDKYSLTPTAKSVL